MSAKFPRGGSKPVLSHPSTRSNISVKAINSKQIPLQVLSFLYFSFRKNSILNVGSHMGIRVYRLFKASIARRSRLLIFSNVSGHPTGKYSQMYL